MTNISELVPGVILLTKICVIGEAHAEKKGNFGTRKEQITPPHSMLFLTALQNLDNDQVLITCIFDGKFIDYTAEKNKLQEQYSVVKIPSIADLDPVDQWLTDYYNVHGKVLFINTYHQTTSAHHGRYSDSNFHWGRPKKSAQDKTFRRHDAIVGIAVRRRAGTRNLVLEFSQDNQIFWKEFTTSKLLKHKSKTFENMFYKLKRPNVTDRSYRNY